MISLRDMELNKKERITTTTMMMKKIYATTNQDDMAWNDVLRQRGKWLWLYCHSDVNINGYLDEIVEGRSEQWALNFIQSTKLKKEKKRIETQKRKKQKWSTAREEKRQEKESEKISFF